ncbi:uncharacterized protein LOC121861161 [Homarus americanus]|uniref:Transmembrane protein n=1 Tax=Homarus americanus TaxID=6706 RepID=A0A8J5T556_HOMAM|nr:uncharacterized protein LOC121861161 [Homarus americanus]KAG7173114.1 hypothetical protein Hamer_G008640 [Homarus americanus]
MKVMVMIIAGLLGLASVMMGDANASEAVEENKRSQETSKVTEEAGEKSHHHLPRRHGRILAFSTTTSRLQLATTTITAVSTCVSTLAAPPPCVGRKKRLLYEELDDMSIIEEDLEMKRLLEGSQVEDEDVEVEPHRSKREVINRNGKRLTIWSTVLSTLTLTSTSYLAGSTVIISALCAAPGISQGCFGK